MAAQGHSGSWLGFTYNGIHSSTLGITRTISGRFNENLIPTMKDTTVSLEGVDGTRYWGTKYTKRDIPVSFAFQGMDKTQLTILQKLLDGREICDLIFDETPYKVYSAKITGSAVMKYIAFEDGNESYYNGEGNITFTCYFPYARSRYVWQEDYTPENIPEWRDPSTQTAPYRNFDEWVTASHIPHQGEYGIYNSTTQEMKIYNAGDIDMPIKLWFNIYWASVEAPFSVTISNNHRSLIISNLARLQVPSPTGAGADKWIMIDMYNAHIEGYDENRKPTGRLYDQFISGDYFLMPVGESTLTITQPPDQVDFSYLYL